MFILKSKDYDLVLTEDEAGQAMKALNSTRKFIFIKNQMIQSAFVSGVYELAKQVQQENAKLSERNKWKCWKCGKVYTYEVNYCNCNMAEYEYLGHNPKNLLT